MECADINSESVTEITGRPLIKVSIADIGIVLTSVEKTLERLFHMAERWGAVLLFDEADILLEQRKSAASIVDMTRNAIVGGKSINRLTQLHTGQCCDANSHWKYSSKYWTTTKGFCC